MSYHYKYSLQALTMEGIDKFMIGDTRLPLKIVA